MTEKGTLRMCDSMTPSIDAGIWTLSSVQNIMQDSKSLNEIPYTTSKEFTIDYTICELEKNTVVNQIPLPHSQGAYTDLIAHIVLKDPYFPWYGNKKNKKTNPEPAVALLMFREEELAKCGGLSLNQTTVAEYLQHKADCLPPNYLFVSESVKKKNCLTFHISTELFDAVTPGRDELAFLAHCRQVYIGDKAEMDLHPEGIFSVVICNRIPEYRVGEKNRYHLHLVSLEGYEDFLDHNSQTRGFPNIELLTLEHWTFEVNGTAPLSFRQFAEGLKEKQEPGSGLLRLCMNSEPRLLDGFVPLLYHTRTGDEGMCWYRSPFCPVITELRHSDSPYFTSDAALIYDPQDGVFDVTLASAWECGRMAALQDSVFCSKMMSLRRKGQELVDAQEELDTGISRFFEKERNMIIGLSKCMENHNKALTDAMAEELLLIGEWLGRLKLLYHVPFHYLIPHPMLLPKESIRFFYIDENWLTAMSDGAVSIGMDCSRQSRFNQMIRQMLHQSTEDALRRYRAELYGQEVPDKRMQVMSGILIRSHLVRFWPTLSIRAWNADGQTLAILRMQLLSNEHMLVIFDGIADKISCNEPQETILMKVEPDFNEFRPGTKILSINKDIWSSPAKFSARFLTTGEQVIFEGSDT